MYQGGRAVAGRGKHKSWGYGEEGAVVEIDKEGTEARRGIRTSRHELDLPVPPATFYKRTTT